MKCERPIFRAFTSETQSTVSSRNCGLISDMLVEYKSV